MSPDPKSETLSAYLDDELDPQEAEAFEDFLAHSPEARQEADEMRSLLEAMSTLPSVQAPPDFYEKLAKKARRARGDRESLWTTLLSLPFQVLSIIVILTIAATYMMLQLEGDNGGLKREDPTVSDPQESLSP